MGDTRHAAFSKTSSFDEFFIRGSVSIIMVIAINRSQIIEFLPNINDAQKVIFCHILFNLLLLLAVPFSGLLERVASKLMAKELENLDDMPVHYRSVINQNNLDNIEVAIASIRREIQRMLLLTEEMMLPIMDLFKEYDVKQMERIIKKDLLINEALNGTRRYVSELSGVSSIKNSNDAHRKELSNLLEFAIAIEAAGDVISKTLSKLVLTKTAKVSTFLQRV